MKNKAPTSTSSFHSKLIELEKIYHLIQESDDRDLENIITLYEKGMKLAAGLEKTIAEYEMRIEEVQAGETHTDTDAEPPNEEHTSTRVAASERKKRPKPNAPKPPESTEPSSAEGEFGTSFKLFSPE